MNNKIIIGSRGSKLALAYANKVKNLISSFDPSIEKKNNNRNYQNFRRLV